MRFKRLSIEELEQLEDDFIKYLIVNGIDADEWSMIKQRDAQKMNDILDEFSDYIHFTTLCHCQFISNVEKTKFTTIQVSNTYFSTYTLELDYIVENETDLENYIKNESIADRISFEVNRIKGNREDSIFRMMQQGYGIDKGRWYRLLAMQNIEA